MAHEPAPDEQLKALVGETQQIWEHKADFWDEQMGEGNSFHSLLVAPAVERLLDAQVGEVMLDVACGNGAFARRLAQLGVQVVATDFSARFLARAQARTTEQAERIAYKQIDATDTQQLLTLGERRFDAAICTMALMDMPVIEPLVSALSRLLKIHGRFVFAVPHPCFNSNATHMFAEQEDRAGALVTTHSIKVTDYLHVPPGKGMGMEDEPAPHYYFHRPLSTLFATCFAAGFVLDGLEEPAFPRQERPAHPFSWTTYQHIPPVLVARMRLPDVKSPVQPSVYRSENVEHE
jgi:2-polyprenyl-3-methyl-5-hydroxy-6-metoxy-1,4-benzoquinol methylase